MELGAVMVLSYDRQTARGRRNAPAEFVPLRIFEQNEADVFCPGEWSEFFVAEGHQPRAHPCARGWAPCGSPLAKATGRLRTRTTEKSISPYWWKHTLHSEVDAVSPVSGQWLPATVFPQVANPQSDIGINISLHFLKRGNDFLNLFANPEMTTYCVGPEPAL